MIKTFSESQKVNLKLERTSSLVENEVEEEDKGKLNESVLKSVLSSSSDNQSQLSVPQDYLEYSPSTSPRLEKRRRFGASSRTVWPCLLYITSTITK